MFKLKNTSMQIPNTDHSPLFIIIDINEQHEWLMTYNTGM